MVARGLGLPFPTDAAYGGIAIQRQEGRQIPSRHCRAVFEGTVGVAPLFNRPNQACFARANNSLKHNRTNRENNPEPRCQLAGAQGTDLAIAPRVTVTTDPWRTPTNADAPSAYPPPRRHRRQRRRRSTATVPADQPPPTIATATDAPTGIPPPPPTSRTHRYQPLARPRHRRP